MRTRVVAVPVADVIAEDPRELARVKRWAAEQLAGECAALRLRPLVATLRFDVTSVRMEDDLVRGMPARPYLFAKIEVR